MKRIIVLTSVMLALPLGLPAVPAATSDKAQESRKDAVIACAEMMQGGGVTGDGARAMREFMKSDKAPPVMRNMMEMARRMGNGDTMFGMTRMMVTRRPGMIRRGSVLS
jgi:hypothetical protein